MHWHSFADFLAMGRHGVYVWGAFAVMALLMAIEPLLLVRDRRRLLDRLRRQRPPEDARDAGAGKAGQSANSAPSANPAREERS